MQITLVHHVIRLDGTAYFEDEKEVAGPEPLQPPTAVTLGCPLVRLRYRLVEEAQGGRVVVKGVHFDLQRSSEWVVGARKATAAREDTDEVQR
jgi:hypothetical protein